VRRRDLLLLNGAFRLLYGLGGVLSPRRMAAAGLAAETEADPQARLFVRGFSSHQVAVAALSLASRRWRRLEQPAICAAIAIDVADLASAAAEAVARGSWDADLAGGTVFSAAGVLTAAAALEPQVP
jgi:hypothetical protein